MYPVSIEGAVSTFLTFLWKSCQNSDSEQPAAIQIVEIKQNVQLGDFCVLSPARQDYWILWVKRFKTVPSLQCCYWYWLFWRKEGQGKKVKKTGSGGLLVAPAPGVPRSRPLVSSASPDSTCSSPQCPGGTALPPAYPLSPGASGPGWSSRSSATRTGWARYVTTSWLRQESKMLCSANKYFFPYPMY